ncbi:MAG: hypothetical protein H0V12_06850 [Chloroflexi bacterium]|nr:hypothetical protein [Chloroflexota bacterium]
MPLDFLKRRKKDDGRAAVVDVAPEEVSAEEYSLKLIYGGKSSNGVRMQAGPAAIHELPSLLGSIAKSEVELVEPLPLEFQGASPMIQRTTEALHWVQANAGKSPIGRHSLLVLESMDAVDPAFETLAIALLHGDLDTSGYPEYNAIVGGVVSHWDEGTGDMIVRAVVGWGGKGVRGDTDRAAGKILGNLLSQILASQHALGVTPIERPMPAGGRGGLVCGHCGFSSLHDRAFYCPKCGMRLLRG